MAEYITNAGKAFGSILRQKMDEYVNANFVIDKSPYACINTVTKKSHETNMKAWLATAIAINDYLTGYMKCSLKTNGVYTYLEQAIVPPPPPILPAIDTLSDKVTYGVIKPKDPYSILDLALPTMIFAGDNTIKDQKEAIKQNLDLIVTWLNVPPIGFTQSTLQQDEDPIYSLNGTGLVIFPESIDTTDVVDKIIVAMDELKINNELTYISANDIFCTGVVELFNKNNQVYSIDAGTIVPLATNKVPNLPGVYFGLSTGTIEFIDVYCAKVQTPIPAPPLGLGMLTLEILLPEVDLSSIVTSFIDLMFKGMDITEDERKEMHNNFGDVIRVSFNGLFENGQLMFDQLTTKLNEFVETLKQRLSISVLTDKLFKRIFNFSKKLMDKIYNFFNYVFDKIKTKITEVMELIFELETIIEEVIKKVIEAITKPVQEFIANFATKVIAKITITIPASAAQVVAALAIKVKNAIAVVKNVMTKIAKIIETVITFVTDLINSMIALVKKIISFIKTIVEWIQTATEKYKDCVSELLGLIATLSVFTSFVSSDPADQAPEMPVLSPEIIKATSTYYVTKEEYKTYGSMIPQGLNEWDLITNYNTSSFTYVNNLALTGTDIVRVFSAYNGMVDSSFISMSSTFTISGNPYNGIVGSPLTYLSIKTLFQTEEITEINNSSQLDYSVYRMINNIYNEETSAMEQDWNQIFYYGYFVKANWTNTDQYLNYYKGWISEKLLLSDPKIIDIIYTPIQTDVYEQCRLIKYSEIDFTQTINVI